MKIEHIAQVAYESADKILHRVAGTDRKPWRFLAEADRDQYIHAVIGALDGTAPRPPDGVGSIDLDTLFAHVLIQVAEELRPFCFVIGDVAAESGLDPMQIN